MESLSKISKVLVLALMLGLAAGCAQEKSLSTNDNHSSGEEPGGDGDLIIPSEPPITDNSPLNGNPGSTAPFFFDSIKKLNNYVQTRPVNDPQNMKINVSLENVGNGRFAGTVKLAYFDTGNYYIGIFESGFGFNRVSYKDMTTGKPEAEYNRWLNDVADNMGKRIFRGFFQDRLGAIILVIDDGIDLGDGGGFTKASGSVWFRNFQVAPSTQSQEKCWFIQIGPYDCRAFVGSNGFINPKLRTYPNNPSDGYTRLGTFNDLDVSKALMN